MSYPILIKPSLFFWNSGWKNKLRNFFGDIFLYFVEYLCNRSPKNENKTLKNYFSLLAVVTTTRIGWILHPLKFMKTQNKNFGEKQPLLVFKLQARTHRCQKINWLPQLLLNLLWKSCTQEVFVAHSANPVSLYVPVTHGSTTTDNRKLTTVSWRTSVRHCA